MFDSYKAIENIQKYIDSNYKQMEDNVKLSSKPFYNPYHQIIKHDMKKTHKPYGDFATRLGTEELEPTTFWDYVVLLGIVIIFALILIGAIDTVMGWF